MIKYNSKNKLNNILILFFVAGVFHGQWAFAREDNNTLVYPSGWFYQDGEAFREINHSIYAPAVIDTFGVFRSPRPGVKKVVTTLAILVNPEVMQSQAFSAVLSGYYKATMLSGARDSVPFTLQINYDPLSGSNYKQRDALSIPGCVHALIVASVQVNGLVISDAENEAFRVEFNNSSDVIYTPRPDDLLAFNPVQEDTRAEHIRWSWSNIPWAEYYELEYIFIDDYSASGGRRNRSDLWYNFRTEAIRIKVKTNSYTMPLIFEQGYLIARVRAVGMTGADFAIPVPGEWSCTASGTLSESGNHVFDISPERCHESDRLNWQYSSGFNEDGFRSEHVIYFDGTHRARQRVLASPEISKVIVSESYHDSYGREVITTLPVPMVSVPSVLTNEPVPSPFAKDDFNLDTGIFLIDPDVLSPVGNTINSPLFNNLPEIADGINLWESPFGGLLEENVDWEHFRDLFSFRTGRSRLGFVPVCNRNSEGGPLLRSDYEVGSKCDYRPYPLSTSGGAAKYYSELNPEQLRWQAYLPNAHGFPYSVTTFSNDGSGRIKSTRLPGEIFHEEENRAQRYYYGNPSQEELFRFFGNDAGHASFYKSTLIVDSDGQSHLSISDLRGNVVLSALAGSCPENLQPIPNTTIMRDTINIISENNVLDAASGAWISTKRLLLNSNTDLALHYELTAPDFSGNFCNGNSFCLDCIYDLAISIVDDCGEVIFSVDEVLGNLSNLLQCELDRIQPDTTLTLSPGSYIISKALRVNEEATEAYVQEYMRSYECTNSLELFLPDAGESCDAACLTCALTTMEKPFTRRTGGPVTLAFSKRSGGNYSDCRLVCSEIGMNDIDIAYHNMLSEVSPGGQYAEYRDTSRLEDRPQGIVNPSVFPVSVLNDANSLPLVAANWRNPAFDYQTKTGDKALVRISELGYPRHRTPEEEIVLRDGNTWVPVKYIELVEDFIRLWEPQWAEALVVYHPEYEYYLWNKRHESSFRFDSLLVAEDSFYRARDLGITDVLSDPLFTSIPALRSAMESAMANVATFDGSPISAAQMAVLSVHCGNPNFDEDERSECFRTRELFTTPGLENKEWQVYKALYRMLKHRMVCRERGRFVLSLGGLDNRSIGGSAGVAANPLYSGKNRLFRDEENLYRELEFDISGETPSYPELMELANRIFSKRFADCGICPVGSDLINFLNALVTEKKLNASNVILDGVSPIILSKAMVESFSIPDADEYTWSRLPDADNSVLRASISVAGSVVANLVLRKNNADISWDSLAWMDCLAPLSDKRFTLRIVDSQFRSDTIQGETDVFNLRDCSFPTVCEPTELRDELRDFLQYIFQYNRYRNSAIQVHSHTTHSVHFGLNLRAAHPNGKSWTWKFAGFNSAQNKAFSSNLSITERNSALMNVPVNCQFFFEIESPGFTFDSLSYVISVQRQNSPIPGYEAEKQASILARSLGGRLFRIRMANSCYNLFRCSGFNPNAAVAGGLCCLRLPVFGRPEIPCEDELQLFALREQERNLMEMRQAAADSVRRAYIDYCLQNAGELLEVSYDNSVYMVTLQYYDLSGALVKTVPPEGIVMLSQSQIDRCYQHLNNPSLPAIRPEHRMVSSYRYTSFGTMASKNTPDGGLDEYMYDYSGRLILKRSSEQRANAKAGYLLYDASNRIIENGQCNYASSWSAFRDIGGFAAGIVGKTDLTIYRYSKADLRYSDYFPGGQKNLRNRLSSMRSQSSPEVNEYAAVLSYDAQGRINRLVQHYSLFDFPDVQTVKTTDFSFDVFNGQLRQMIYQKDKFDQFVHWISYDSNKRVRTVRTSTSLMLPEYLREDDVNYYYYEHGPVARMELGEEKIQGVDFAYTLQGWEKARNGFGAGNSEFDMGRDGSSEGDRFAAAFPADVVGEVCNYYPQDYSRIGNAAASFLPVDLPSVASSDFSKPLYNGHIQSIMQCVSHAFEDDVRKGFVQSYAYDQSGRLLEARNLFSTGITLENDYSDAYRMKVTYDLSGNIQTLQRANKEGLLFDNMAYFYDSPGNNSRLNYIDDTGSGESGDFSAQSPGNYSYDASGRLIADLAGNIRAIRYNPEGKPTEVDVAGQTITYKYDALGRKIAKISAGFTEWYVNDNLGNTMAIYRIEGADIRWMEATIYGGKRVGIYRPEILMSGRSIARDSLIRGAKYYELGNRLGDVIAVVSDRKLPGLGSWRADIRKAENYFPYGYSMPGRSYNSDNYRYGFQGMMQENSLYGNGSAYITEFRLYDSRIARWLSIDPMAEKLPRWSPYTAFDANPISLIDPKGAQTRPDPHDPAVQIAALGELVDGFGNALLGIISLPSTVVEIVGESSREWYSIFTDDYSREGREDHDFRNLIADGLIGLLRPVSGIDIITPDERARLRRMLRTGLFTTIVEENLRMAYPDASDEAIEGMAGVVATLATSVASGAGMPSIPDGIDGALSGAVEAGSAAVADRATTVTIREPDGVGSAAGGRAAESTASTAPPASASEGSTGSGSGARPEASSRSSRRSGDAVSARETRRRERQRLEAERIPRRERAARSGATRRPRE